MSEYKMALCMGGWEVVATGPDPDWVKARFEEVFASSAEAAKKIPLGFSVTSFHSERSWDDE